MKDKRFIAGVVISGLWGCFFLYMLASHTHPTDLNAWGDFFGGFFAPLAFLWLVLGYMQQGEELRHSSEALRLQAEELKNSVEQQSQLVEVSRKQLQQEIEAINEEKQRRREAALPKFIIRGGGGLSGGPQGTLRDVSITNVGNKAAQVTVTIGDNDGNQIGKVDVPLVGLGDKVPFKIAYQTSMHGKISIFCYDADYRVYQTHWSFFAQHMEPINFKEISE